MQVERAKFYPISAVDVFEEKKSNKNNETNKIWR